MGCQIVAVPFQSAGQSSLNKTSYNASSSMSAEHMWTRDFSFGQGRLTGLIRLGDTVWSNRLDELILGDALATEPKQDRKPTASNVQYCINSHINMRDGR